MAGQNYEEEQKKRMASYVNGGCDSLGNTIAYIYSKGDEYVIYGVKSCSPAESIKVWIDERHENDHSKEDNFCQVREKFAKLKGVLYKVRDDVSIKYRIAHILSHAIGGKVEEANKQFDELMQEIEDEYAGLFRHRLYYLLSALGVVFLCIFFSIVVYHWKLFSDSEFVTLTYVCTMAAIGGFISISRRMKKIEFEKGVKDWLFIMYGSERIFIAVAGGVISYLAIKSNLIGGIVQELPKPVFGYMFFATLSGFSETFIPNLLIRVESKETCGISK